MPSCAKVTPGLSIHWTPKRMPLGRREDDHRGQSRLGAWHSFGGAWQCLGLNVYVHIWHVHIYIYMDMYIYIYVNILIYIDMYMCKDQQSRGNNISSKSNVYMHANHKEGISRGVDIGHSTTILSTTRPPYDKCTQGCFLAIGCPRFMQVGTIKLGQKHWWTISTTGYGYPLVMADIAIEHGHL